MVTRLVAYPALSPVLIELTHAAAREMGEKPPLLTADQYQVFSDYAELIWLRTYPFFTRMWFSVSELVGRQDHQRRELFWKAMEPQVPGLDLAAEITRHISLKSQLILGEIGYLADKYPDLRLLRELGKKLDLVSRTSAWLSVGIFRMTAVGMMQDLGFLSEPIVRYLETIGPSDLPVTKNLFELPLVEHDWVDMVNFTVLPWWNFLESDMLNPETYVFNLQLLRAEYEATIENISTDSAEEIHQWFLRGKHYDWMCQQLAMDVVVLSPREHLRPEEAIAWVAEISSTLSRYDQAFGVELSLTDSVKTMRQAVQDVFTFVGQKLQVTDPSYRPPLFEYVTTLRSLLRAADMAPNEAVALVNTAAAGLLSFYQNLFCLE